jgi:hypothetical protein
MKKLLFIAIVAMITAFQASAPQGQNPVFAVQGTIQDWEIVVQVINQSNAPHTTVEAAKKFIVEQVNIQLKTLDSLNKKAAADSLQRKKKS